MAQGEKTIFILHIASRNW